MSEAMASPVRVANIAPWVYFFEFANRIRYWTIPQQNIVRRVQTKAIIAIKREFDEADINIPYPIRTVYYYDQHRFNDYLPIHSQDSDR